MSIRRLTRSLAVALMLAACGSCGESDDGASGGKPDAASAADGSGGTSGLDGGDASTDSGVTDSGATDAKSDAPSDASPDAPLAACPTFTEVASPGNVGLAEITETSGLVVSQKSPALLFVHNDSGDTARFFALSTAGKHLGIFTLTGASAIDWEDMAAAKGDLYFGDIGDNNSARPNVVVYRVPEPAIPATPSTVALAGAATFTFTYPGGARNAETLFVDPVTGDLFIVQKLPAGKSGVYRKPAPLASGELELVAEVDFGPLTTGGDISPSGDAILIRTYNTAQLFRRGPGMSVANALLGEPCSVPLHGEPQGETIAFGALGNTYFTVSEGVNQPIFRFQKP